MSKIILPNKVHYLLIIVAFAFAAFQQCYRIGYEQIKIWDEGSGARNAVEMLANKNYIVVMHNEKPDHEDVKPSLSFRLCFKVFGEGFNGVCYN